MDYEFQFHRNLYNMLKNGRKGKMKKKALLICLARLFTQAKFTLIYGHTTAKPKDLQHAGSNKHSSHVEWHDLNS